MRKRGYMTKRCGCGLDQRAACRHSWRLVVSAGTDPETRRLVQAVEGFNGTRRDARARLTGMLAEMDRGTLARPGSASLGEYLTEWLAGVAAVSRSGHPLAPTTRKRYADAVAHVSTHIGQVKMRDLRPVHVERLRDALLRQLAPQTTGDVLRVLSQALRRGVSRGVIARNPADAEVVARPAGKPAPFVLIDPGMAEGILAAAKGEDPWDVAAHLALGLTLRREEVLGLRWADVELEAGTLSVRRTLTYADGAMHEGGTKSEAGERTVALPRPVLESLRRHRAAQAERRLALGGAWRETDLVVDAGDGSPWLPPSFSKGWSRFADRAGFADVTFHGLRHGAASLMLAAGVPDAVALRVMGHTHVRMLQRYRDVVPDLLRDAAARMESVLGGSGVTPG